jgi:hypothetical protein
VLALDPFNQVIWQYRVARQAQITTGPGAVLVRDSNGLQAIDELGTVVELPPLPSGATVLAVAGGAAWFTTNERAWRLRLSDRSVQALALDALPLGAPLVRGTQSLWLTARDLLLFDGDRLMHRFQHQLPAETGWHLAVDGDRPLIVNTEKQTWRLESFSEQLLRLDSTAKAELFMQARRYDEALIALGEPNDEPARRVALRAHLAKGAHHVLHSDVNLDRLCVTAQDRALLLMARLGAAGPSGRWFTATSAHPSAPALLSELDALTERTPDVWLTPNIEVLADDPSTWDYACTGAAWVKWRKQTLLPTTKDKKQLVAELPILASSTPISERRSDGSLTFADVILRLDRRVDAISVNCRNKDGTLLWRQRWRPANFMSAPSQTIDPRDGLVLVVEGTIRLSAFSLAHGGRHAQFTHEQLANGLPYVVGDQLAILGPLGINNTLTWITNSGQQTQTTLVDPVRWVAPLADALLVVSRNGVARLQPSGRTIPLPDELLRTHTPPTVTPEGLVHSERLWPWVR